MIAGSATAAAAPEAYSIACTSQWRLGLGAPHRAKKLQAGRSPKKGTKKKIDKNQRPEMSNSK